MISKASISITAVLLLLSAAGARNFTYAADQKPSEEVDCFGDGIALFSLLRTSGIEGKSSTAILVDAKLVKIGDRYFVRGRIWLPEDTEKRASHGVDTAIAWNDVVAFCVFTEDQLKAYLSERKEE